MIIKTDKVKRCRKLLYNEGIKVFDITKKEVKEFSLPNKEKEKYEKNYVKRLEELFKVILHSRVTVPRRIESFREVGAGRSCHNELEKVLDNVNLGKGPDALNEYKFANLYIMKKFGHVICQIEPNIEKFEESNFYKKALVSVIFFYSNSYEVLKGIYICDPSRLNKYYAVLKRAWEIAYYRPNLLSDVFVNYGSKTLIKLRTPSKRYKNNCFAFGEGILDFMKKL